ncbi:hypothetical protein XA68_17063 [Ophiocordyceps unilateralis]|uniref:Yeast cell wall synthesis Kre9/Knh1-like N-terminal domain-containing protein n=1 Tax=Ophiocordyceps unilateralis TaxID=268505 RepID=A0A2A9P544_OPHUN|nr:hypothetical protein XA68_17063 [Ophiocordyceps unilateralis]
MRVTFTLATLVATALAQTPTFNVITKPYRNEAVQAGQPFTIRWDAPTRNGPEDKVNIELIGGRDENTLEPIVTIASGVPNNQLKFDWNVDATLGTHPAYGIIMKLASDPSIFQYSSRFNITNNGASESPASSPGVKTIILSSSKPAASTTPLPAAYAPTTAVAASPVVASNPALAPAKSVDCEGKNSTAVLSKPTGLSAAPSVNNSTVLNPGSKSNGSVPIQATSGAAPLHSSLFGLIGGLMAVALAL